MEMTRTTWRVKVDHTVEPEPEEILELTSSQEELDDVNELDDFQFVYALALRALEHEALACETDAAKQQVAHLLDRLTSIEWLVAE